MDLEASIVFPIYNESSILRQNVYELERCLEELGLHYEILLCDDNSSDIREFSMIPIDHGSVRYFRFSTRIGKGGTIKNALRLCRGKTIILLDADTPISTNELMRGAMIMSDGEKLVIGVRRTRPSSTFSRKVLSIAFNGIVGVAFKTGIHDHQCGFKLIDRRMAQTLFPLIHSDHFFFDAELIITARSKGIKVEPMEVKWLERRSRGDSRVSSPRIAVMMFVDLLLLRITFLRKRRLLRYKEEVAGSFVDVGSGARFPAHVTMIDSSHRRVTALLRRMYLALAFGV